MVTRLRPLDVSLAFDDRIYQLGETINIRVELNARGNVEVREGRVDLVCQQRWTEVTTVMVMVSTGALPSTLGAVPAVPSVRVPKKATKEYRESFVHSSIIFLEDTQLNPETTSTHDLRLEIQEIPTLRTKDANTKWSLVTVLDIAHARDIKTRRTVHIATE